MAVKDRELAANAKALVYLQFAYVNNALSENIDITYSKNRNSENTNILLVLQVRPCRLALRGVAENVFWMELNGIDLSKYPTPYEGIRLG